MAFGTIVESGTYRILVNNGITERWVGFYYRIYNTGITEIKQANNRWATWEVGKIPEGAEMLS